MKKTNRKWIEGLIHTYANTTMTRDEFSNAVVEYIERRERKAERRGAKHESKRWSKQPIWSEYANGITTFYGTFETLKQQPVPQFDAKNVRHLLGILMFRTAKQGERKGKENITAYNYDDDVLDARKKLLAALGIED